MTPTSALSRTSVLSLSKTFLQHFNLYNPLHFAATNTAIVYLELLVRGYDVKVGKTDDYEIDFVVYKGSDTLYVQVCYLLASTETVEREFGNLERIKDNYPKYVISGDLPDFSRNGIKHYNIIKFLLNE